MSLNKMNGLKSTIAHENNHFENHKLCLINFRKPVNVGTVFEAPDMTGFHFLAEGSTALLFPVCMKARNI